MRRLLVAAGVTLVALLLHIDALAGWAISTNNPASLATATLAAPTNFAAATASGPTRVILTWTAPPAANQGYQTDITRLDTSTWTTTTLVAAGGAASTFTDTGVVKGQTYCYLPSTVAGPWSAAAPLASAKCVIP